jgi:hypothetical protein
MKYNLAQTLRALEVKGVLAFANKGNNAGVPRPLMMYEITRMQKEPTKQPVSAHIKRILNPRWA